MIDLKLVNFSIRTIRNLQSTTTIKSKTIITMIQTASHLYLTVYELIHSFMIFLMSLILIKKWLNGWWTSPAETKTCTVEQCRQASSKKLRLHQNPTTK